MYLNFASIIGLVAQLVEQSLCKRKVRSSNLLESTTKEKTGTSQFFLLSEIPTRFERRSDVEPVGETASR